MQTTDSQLRGALHPRAETLEQMEERHRAEWELVHGAYGVEELPSQLQQRHAEERTAWAWRQPAFSKETINADPWTAVYLPIPENLPGSFGDFTLRDVRALVREMMVATVEPNDWEPVQGRLTFDKLALGPALNPDSYTREGNFAAAGERFAELEARLNVEHSRWTGESLGESAGMTQSGGQGQSHR
jgi:hypothetical protein